MLGKKKKAKTNVAEAQQQAAPANATAAVAQQQATQDNSVATAQDNNVQTADNQTPAMPQETVSQMGTTAFIIYEFK